MLLGNASFKAGSSLEQMMTHLLLFGYIFWYFYLIQIHSLIFAPEFIVNTLLI